MMPSIPILFMGSENWQASHVFNSNAFPGHTSIFVSPCMDCLSMLTFSVNQVEINIERDRNEFPDNIKRNEAFDGFTPDPNKPLQLHTACLQTIIVSLP